QSRAESSNTQCGVRPIELAQSSSKKLETTAVVAHSEMWDIISGGIVFLLFFSALTWVVFVFYFPFEKNLPPKKHAAREKARVTVAEVIGVRISDVRLTKDAKARDFKALEEDGQLMAAINAIRFGWDKEAAASPALRIELRGGNNVVI